MKQFIIDQMKEYQHKKEIVKAIKYQEGMEDAWMVEYEEYIEDNKDTTYEMVDKIFWSKESAEEYMKQEHPEDNKKGLFCKYTNPIPVLLREILEDEYDDYCFVVAQDGKYFEYHAMEENSWIVIDKNGYYVDYDSEIFFETYEEILSEKSVVHIGYDIDLEEYYIEMNSVRLTINKTEVATVEKLLDVFKIPFTEKIGQAFLI